MSLEELKDELSAKIAKKEQLKAQLKCLDEEIDDLKWKIQSKQMTLPGFETLV